jgi:hypothetical protein
MLRRSLAVEWHEKVLEQNASLVAKPHVLTGRGQRMDFVPSSMCDGPPAARERLWLH